METKICSKCHKEKYLSEFDKYLSRPRKDNSRIYLYYSKCHKCTLEYQKYLREVYPQNKIKSSKKSLLAAIRLANKINKIGYNKFKPKS